jgi:heat shock protein HslJ
MKFKLSSVAVLLVGVGLILAACAPATPAAPAPVATVASAATSISETKSDSALAGTSWQLATLWPPPGSTPVPPEDAASLTFGPDRYTGFAGCDWYQGMYSLDGSGIFMQQPAKTIGGCVNKPAATEQQSTFLSMLTSATTYEVKDGKLVLYNTDKQQLLTMTPLEPSPFEGTTWQALFYFTTDGGIWVPALPGATVTAKFDGKTMSGNAGCNDYSASYTRNGNLIQLGPVTATQKTCATPDGVMEQEQGYLKMLDSVRVIQQFPRSLEFLTSDNTPLLAFHAE